MVERKHIETGVGILLVLALIGGIIWYTKQTAVVNQDTTTDENIISDGAVGVGITGDGEAVVEGIPTTIDLGGSTITQPALNRPLTFSPSFPADARAIIQDNIATLTAQLEDDPDSFQGWADLAIQYKIIGDYQGAAEVWEFLNKTAPGNTLTRINLGNLYHYQLKEYAKAEAVFREAIALNAQTLEAYLGLYELYRYSYKTDTNLAEQSLLDGLKIFPHHIDFLITLAGYYKDNKRFSEAKKYYTEARDEAEKVGNAPLVEALNKEIAGL